MPTGNGKGNDKHLLSATGLHHLKTIDLEGHQAAADKNVWNYNEFVARLMEVIVALRTKDKQKNVPKEK